MNSTPWTTTLQPQPWTVTQPAWTCPTTLEGLAAGFAPISLKEMDAAALLDRTDTKFVLTFAQLLSALAAVRADYWMLEVNGRRLNRYRTLYFDTPEFHLYNDHLTGRAERYKVRSREYVDTQLAFLEVKHKTRKDRTVKSRIPTGQQVLELNDNLGDWLSGVAPLDAGELYPALWNTFTRLTLVSKQLCERVTLDVDLTFATDDRAVRMDGLAVAEVKMDRCTQCSPFLDQMRAMRVRQHGFSKYAVGVALLYAQARKNGMKPTLLWVEKIQKGTLCHD
jgi:hypothetical protein